MDDLTARALQNQSHANTNYNSKQRREEQQKVLTEAPAFVTGFEGGKHQLERLGQDPIADGVPVTNGLLQVGRRVTTTGQYVDGVTRVKPVVSAAPIVEATGKIKYLYSALNADGSKDLWLGGWQPKPVKIKAIAVGESGFYLRNTGGNGYFVDYRESTAFVSVTAQGEVYRFANSNVSDGLDFYGYSFLTRPVYGSGTGGFPYWGKLFQGVFLGGLDTDATGSGHYYLLPNLTSPKEFEGFDIYRTVAINQDGTQGVGYYTSTDALTIAAFSTGIMETNISVYSNAFLNSLCFDCFDDNFSAIDTSTFSADVLHKAKFTGTIGIYGFDALQQRTVKTTIYGILAAQRSTATLIGRPSYHA